jgi:hypothetical protein
VVEVWAELPAHVIIDCQAGKDLLAVQVGRDSVADFARTVQVAVVAEVVAAGGSGICEDSHGRFIRSDGSPVLAG